MNFFSVQNTLAYYDTTTITVVISFRVQAIVLFQASHSFIENPRSRDEPLVSILTTIFFVIDSMGRLA
jgi:hypothetical protein